MVQIDTVDGIFDIKKHSKIKGFRAIKKLNTIKNYIIIFNADLFNALGVENPQKSMI